MPFTQGHALIIGVGTHKLAAHADVPITKADAAAVAAILCDANACGYPSTQVKFIHDEGATKAGILAELDALAQRAGEKDTVFLFYAGHGALGAQSNYYLVSHDAQIQDARVVEGTGVSEAELLDKLRAIKAQRMVLIFNACHAGNISPTLDLAPAPLATSNPSEDAAAALLGTGQGRIIITACREEQVSYIGTGKLTIFTQALVDGLRGKGVANRKGFISVFNLYEYLYETVHEFVQTNLNAIQEPELTVLKGIGAFAVALYRGASSLGEFDGNEPLPQGLPVREVRPEKSARLFQQHIEQSGGVNFGQGNEIDIQGDVFGGDKVQGPQIDARRAQGFIYEPQGPVEQNFGDLVDTGGAAYISGSVNTGGGDFVGRDKTVRGDLVHGDKVGGDKVAGDKIAVGNISGSAGVAIGQGAQATVNAGFSGNKFQAREIIIVQGGNLPERFEAGAGSMHETTPMTKEAIRLDIAYPETAVVNETFDIAVAIRQPDAPKLALDDLVNVIAREGAVYRSAAMDIVKYRVEVNAPGCEIEPAKYTFFLKSGENSLPCFFHITPKREGRLSILVLAYQDDDALAAHTRVLVEARMLVVEPVNTGVANSPRAELTRLLNALRTKLASVQLEEDEQAAVQQDLSTVEAQLQKPEPKLSLIKRGLNNIKAVLEEAAGVGTAATALAALIQRALDMAQQLFR